MKQLLLWTLILMCTWPLVAQDVDSLANTQTDTLVTNDDHIEIFTEISTLNPKRSAILSAVLPGLGQIYNKQYWKVPLIYGEVPSLLDITFGTRIACITSLDRPYWPKQMLTRTPSIHLKVCQKMCLS